eukprot:CAMPEP_0115091486 /NCGR_PEP_ID=MMETSP0227-20121206/26138_1 /TAXON_ID=89957 /ORGANISM="Polarella glacialis, Strain CCMP 1383" /LENGTH=81 /DNA_ID=CAMNT_0002483001 /DNA_START=105 /DNA_END=347 /DNA_ORIENTATION=-
MSPSRTGPFTLRIRDRPASSGAVSVMNITRTWITPPREPVRPSTLSTLASFTPPESIASESKVVIRGIGCQVAALRELEPK